MFSNYNNEKAEKFIFNESYQFEERTKHQYYAAFAVIFKNPIYFDLLELNSDDPRLLHDRNAFTAYCHYVLTQLPPDHFRVKLITQLLENHTASQLDLPEKIKKGEIVKLPTQSFLTPNVDIFDYLQRKNKNVKKEWMLSSSGEMIFLSDLQVTIFQNAKVVFHDVDVISELVAATKAKTYDELSQLIAYRPETIALHEALTAVASKVQLKPQDSKEQVGVDYEGYLLTTADEVLREAEAEIAIQVKELYALRQILEAKVFHQMESKNGEFSQEIANSVKRIKVENFGQYVQGFTKDKAIHLLTVDLIFTKIAEEKFSSTIQQKIADLIASKKLTPYQIPEPHERKLFLLSGGQASGKSSMGALRFMQQAAALGGWQNVHKFSVDALKKEILAHSEIKKFPQELFSSMTQNQASMIMHHKMLKKLEVEATLKKAPHIFIEQLMVGQDKINLGLLHHGSVHIIVVSAEIEDCIERAFIRGTKTGRYTAVQSMLYAHREVVRQLPDRIIENVGKAVFIEIIDNNVPKDHSSHLIAEIHCEQATINLHDVKALEKFIHKIAINPKAPNFFNLYNKNLEKDVSIAKYFEKLETLYEINFLEKNQLQRKIF